ncbi:MAG: hypothetical protein HRT87_08420 [Legionellales bacterium]|nr:hypothetical protein [Legionellales bacterium]
MLLKILIPSKTFLVGEHHILNGGTAILIATKPFFKFTISKQSKGTNTLSIPFHKDSPPAKFINENLEIFKGYTIEFKDQHNNCGGFGASGAEFLGCYLAKEFLTSGNLSINKICSNSILNKYWEYCQDKIRPSGADIITQLHGSITIFNSLNFSIHNTTWQFDDLGFYLIPTYNKLATHLHLKNISSSFDSELEKTIINTKIAINSKDSSNFINQINIFNNYLINKDLVAKKTINLLHILKQCPTILAAKGCGALGADVILVLFNTKNKKRVLEFITEQNLTTIGSESDIVNGIKIISNNLDQNGEYNEMVC